MPVSDVQVRGIGPLIADLRNLQRSIDVETRAELRQAAELVEGKARHIARDKGLYNTGRLIGSTKAFARGSRAGVRTSANRSGFPYPAVHEFGGRGSGTHGSRAFQAPALEELSPEIVDEFSQMIGRMAARNGFLGAR